MTTKRQDSKIAAKTCWAISSRLFHNKKIPAILPVLVICKHGEKIRTGIM